MATSANVFGDAYRRTRALGFTAGVVVLFSVATYLEFWAGLLLAALCPMAYLTLGMAGGHILMVVLSLVPSVAERRRLAGDIHDTG